MRKRIISMMLVICMVLMYVPTTALAVTSGTTEDGWQYTISDAGEVTIKKYTGSNTDIVIPNKIDGKSVTAIGAYAFENKSLTSVEIPTSVTSIGGQAFLNCTGLTSVTISDGVTAIGEYAFCGCTSLASVVIPNSVTVIDRGAFDSTPWLTSRQGENPLVVVNGILINGKNASGEVSIPKGVKTIGNYVFSDCTELTSVTIPDGVTAIGEYAFKSCTKLANITIPSSVTSIGSGAFDFTPWLTSRQGENPLVIVNGILINGKNASGEVSIPEGVKTIGNYVFSGCTGLTSVEIPSSVTSVGERAFDNCTGLTSIEIPNKVTSIGDFAFCSCSSLGSIIISDSVTSIGEGAFYGCTGLTSVNIPEGVTSIEMSTFCNCRSLTSITIPNSVTSIGNQVFEGCIGFTSVTIPSSVTSIGNDAFKGCTGLGSITIPDSITSIGNQVFEGCTGFTSVTIPSSVTSIGNDAFKGCTGLGSVDIQDGVKSIGGFAFCNCTNLESITIPDSVTSIGNQAFYNCTNLESITIPDSVTSIGVSAFGYCTNLTDVTIPSSVESIVARAFESCTSLTSVTIPNSVKEIGGSAFIECARLTTIFLPDKNLTIREDAIPATASQVKYRLDTVNNKVTITQIPGEIKVDIPATICGYPVVAVENKNLLNKISSHIHLGVNCTDKVKCTICGKEYIHNLVNIPAKAATYSADGNIEYWHCKVCGKYFSDENGTNKISQQDTVIPKLIYNTPTESFTSPVSDGNAIEIKASISDGVAKVSEITTETIDKMLNNASSNGETKVDTIKIDLSGAKQEVKAVTLSKKTLETLATAIASEDNDIDTVTIVLSKASVVLDSKTLETVVKEAKGNDIKLVINDKKISKLNTSQQNAIKKYHVATLFEAIFESNGKAIHDFNGGTATVTINFESEEGKNMDYYHMVHISDDGVMTRYKTRYTKGKLIFTTPHFSDYAVIYDESEKNQTAIERPVPVTGIDATVDKTTLTKKGAIATIKVTVQPEDATNKNVTYTSSNTKIAKVDKTGKVTAVANGKTTITIKTVDGAFTKKIVITVKIPDPMPTKAQIAANGIALNSNATAKWTKENYLKLTWGKVTGAAGYEIYVRKCDGKTLWTKPVYTAKSGKTTSVTLKKLGGKKFSTTANYKYGVRAYKYVNGKKVYIGTSLTYHFVGSKNKKETNAKSVTAGKKSITLRVKKTTKLTSKVTKVNTKRTLVKHDTLVRYISSNPSVAKVDLNTGKVIGVKAGKCKIYCIALNGVKTTVSVTVK